MLWFKKNKVRIEDHVRGLVENALPKAVAFFTKENKHSHSPLNINHTQLQEVGAGMILFYLGNFFPDTNPENLTVMSRAFKEIERVLPGLGAAPKAAHVWWKAYTDGLIFQENEPRLKIACRITWEKLIPDRAHREASPLRTFAYFLEMEVESTAKLNII